MLSVLHGVLLQSFPPAERAALQQQLDPLVRVAKAHSRGPEEYCRSIVQELLSQFADVEEKFQSSTGMTTEQEMIDTLRKSYPNDHQAVLDMVISHQGLALKTELVKRILSTLVLPAPVPYRALLRRFAALSSKATAEVAVRAQQLLVGGAPMLARDSEDCLGAVKVAVPIWCRSGRSLQPTHNFYTPHCILHVTTPCTPGQSWQMQSRICACLEYLQELTVVLITLSWKQPSNTLCACTCLPACRK